MFSNIFFINECKLSFHLIIWVRFPYIHLTAQISILYILFCLFIFLWFFIFFLDFDGYYIVRTDEGQPRPKYIFNKCGTNIYLFTLQRFGPSSTLPNFKSIIIYLDNMMYMDIIIYLDLFYDLSRYYDLSGCYNLSGYYYLSGSIL